jgi:hypothetical protein
MVKLFTILVTFLTIINIIISINDYYTGNLIGLVIQSVCGWLCTIVWYFNSCLIEYRNGNY